MTGLHAWGVFDRKWHGRGLGRRMAWVLLSHHKTSHAAAQRSRAGQVVCRISNFKPTWERP